MLGVLVKKFFRMFWVGYQVLCLGLLTACAVRQGQGIKGHRAFYLPPNIKGDTYFVYFHSFIGLW